MNESFLSIGVTVIVSVLLAKLAISGVKAVTTIWKGMKEAVYTMKEYSAAVKELNSLLEPYKNELLAREWSSKLFDENKIITIATAQKDGASIAWGGIAKDVEAVLSAEDYKKYVKIIEPILDTNIYLMN